MEKIIRTATIPASLNTFCRDILHELSSKYEVIALSSPGEVLDEIANREEVRTIGIPMARHISPLKDFLSLWRLVRVFRKESPLMVHSMTPKAGLLCMVAAWITKVPVRVHTFTGLVFPTSTGLKRRILMMTDAITCKCATHIIPEGEGVKKDLLRYGITSRSMHVLGYGNIRGVDMDFYSRRPEVMAMAEQIRDDRRFTFLYVGRIVRDKGINELCEAFHWLTGPYPARLVIVGSYEDKLDPISDVSKKLIEDNDHIEYVGSKRGDELLAYYAAADCFVLPSYREGFPNTVLEAGAMGLPCIVTDVNGSREIIEDGMNGLIGPSKNTQALYDAMMKMMADVTIRSRMASVARKMVADRFEQGFVRKCLFDFYDEILVKMKDYQKPSHESNDRLTRVNEIRKSDDDFSGFG